MAESKYRNLITRASVKMDENNSNPIFKLVGEDYGIDAGWTIVPVTKPFIMMPVAHRHEFHQFLCFLGSDPNNIDDLGAEIEISLGEEGEKHIITEPSIVHLSPGVIHGPLEYKRVDKAVMHLDVFFASEYKKVPVE